MKPFLSGSSHGSLRVASVGECMVEMAPSGDTGQFQQAFAGDSFNTLWYLRQVAPDWSVRYVSGVGRDAISDDMLAMMQNVGVETSHILRDGSRTVGLYMIALQNGERSFSYWRGQSAARHLADDPARLAAALEDVDIVFFSGITLAILDVPARATFLQALRRARGAGKTTVFDPNLRPRLWPDGDAMRTATMEGASVSDMVLPSFDEEAQYFGDADIAATCARYLGRGALSVVAKNGDGAVGYHHLGQTGTVSPDPVSAVVDTTSAGDSFNAGLLASLGSGASIDAAICQASRLAAQVIGQKGALCTLDVDAVMAG